MAWKRKPQCPIPGCTELKKVNEAQGTLYGYCQKHLNKAARDRDRRAYAARQSCEVPAMLSALDFAPPQHEDAQRLLLINPLTSRAQWYEVLLASPARAVVPEDPEGYGRFVRLAQEAGYTVVIECQALEN